MMLSTKLVASFLLVAAIPAAILSLVFYTFLYREFTQRSLAQLSSIASQQEQRLNVLFNKYNEDMANMISSLPFKIAVEKLIKSPSEQNRQELRQIVSKQKDRLSNVRDFAVTDLKGGDLLEDAHPHILTSEEEELISEVKVRDKIVHPGLESGEPRFHFFQRILIDGQLVGIVHFDIDTDEIDYIVRNFNGLGQTGETTLAHSLRGRQEVEFVVPLRHDPEAAFTKKVPLANPNFIMARAIKNEETVHTEATDYRGEPVLAATRFIEAADLGMVVKIDKKEVYAPIGQISLALAGAILLIVVGVSLLAVLMARRITQPIERLTKIAQEIESGNLEIRTKIQSEDEIGTLAQAFDHMAVKLGKSYKDLESKVTERTKDLDIKLKEVEELNRYMIDRELKMVELKKELEKLRKKA